MAWPFLVHIKIVAGAGEIVLILKSVGIKNPFMTTAVSIEKSAAESLPMQPLSDRRNRPDTANDRL